jgi:Flp pilus assembly protein TadB
MSVLLLAGVAAAATWLAVPRGARRLEPEASVAVLRSDEKSSPRPWLRALLAGGGCWAFVSGPAGLVAGVLLASVVWVVVSRAESPAERARRAKMRAELPHVVGLLAAACRAGLPPGDGLALVCQALPGPAADRLATLPPKILLGIDPVDVWRSLEADGVLAPLGRTLARSSRTGEPLADALERLGNELAARARAEIEEAARRVGVLAAVPLGVCLLPAFLLLGIVPVVGGLVTDLAG